MVSYGLLCLAMVYGRYIYSFSWSHGIRRGSIHQSLTPTSWVASDAVDRCNGAMGLVAGGFHQCMLTWFLSVFGTMAWLTASTTYLHYSSFPFQKDRFLWGKNRTKMDDLGVEPPPGQLKINKPTRIFTMYLHWWLFTRIFTRDIHTNQDIHLSTYTLW